MAICQGESKDTAGLFAMMVWVLWNNRNNKVWNESKEEGRSLGIKSRHLWEEWHSVQHCQHDSPSPVQQQQQHLAWQKPPMDWYKCNVDAGFYNELNKTSAGWCLRDHTGNFVVVDTYWNEGKCSITEGESIALLEAMKGMEHR
ncbi:polynucleotidyl transferase ribonuclease H fold, partial [Trifolium medium]|nr:polynucleotidyl transferase ribonuclease H fold [Trifolium medium]